MSFSAVSVEAQRQSTLLDLSRPISIQVQSVLFNTEGEHLERAFSSLLRAAELANQTGVLSHLTYSLGDCSPFPCIGSDAVEEMQNAYSGLVHVKYSFFDKNLGSAKAHNWLAKSASTDVLFTLNPDVIVSPVLLIEMCETFKLPGIGIVEARQLPIEHPKYYDTITGETSWASTGCCMFPTQVFRQVGGFDSESFFLYCDDVDFSWRVRLNGLKVIFQPGAVVFHDKRLSNEGKWIAGAAEEYYSAEAALTLARKWSRPDLVEKILSDFDASGSEVLKKAAGAFRDKVEAGVLPEPIDEMHQVGQFVGQFYAKHRFAL